MSQTNTYNQTNKNITENHIHSNPHTYFLSNRLSHGIITALTINDKWPVMALTYGHILVLTIYLQYPEDINVRIISISNEWDFDQTRSLPHNPSNNSSFWLALGEIKWTLLQHVCRLYTAVLFMLQLGYSWLDLIQQSIKRHMAMLVTVTVVP